MIAEIYFGGYGLDFIPTGGKVYFCYGFIVILFFVCIIIGGGLHNIVWKIIYIYFVRLLIYVWNV